MARFVLSLPTPRRGPPAALAAAPIPTPSTPPAPRVVNPNPATADAGRDDNRSHRGVLAWQQELCDFEEIPVGELSFASNFMANCGRVTSLVAAWRADGGGEPTPVTVNFEDPESPPDPEDIIAMRRAEAIRSSVGGQAALMERWMANIAVYGDVWHLITETVDTETGTVLSRSHEALSIWELSEERRNTQRRLMRRQSESSQPRILCEIAPGAPAGEVEHGGRTTVFLPNRIWQSDRVWSSKAYSAMQGTRQTLRIIQLCDALIEATLASRVATRGLMLVPDTVDGFGETKVEVRGADDDPEVGDGEKEETFVDELARAAGRNRKDHRTAVASLPFFATVPAEAISQFKLIEWSGRFEATLIQLREAAVLRFAQQTDLPVSVVTGETGNRWSDFVIKESLFQMHISPKLALICDSITEQFYRADLAAAFMAPTEKGGLGYSEVQAILAADRYSLWFDASGLIARPDQTDTADKALDRFAISYAAYRRMKGIDESDAPDLEELTKNLALDLVKAAPSTLAPALFPLLGLPTEGLIVSSNAGLIDETASGQISVAGAGDSVTPAGEPPRTVTPVTGPPPSAAASTVEAAFVAGVVQAACVAAMHRAGTQIVSKLAGRNALPGERERIAALPPHERGAALGAERLAQLGLGVGDLFGTHPVLEVLGWRASAEPVGRPHGLSKTARQRIGRHVETLCTAALTTGRLDAVDEDLIASILADE